MFKPTGLLIVLCLLSAIFLHGQSNRSVYLGPKMDSLFIKDSFHRKIIDSTEIFSGLGCTRLYYETTDDPKDDRDVIHPGLILRSKSIDRSVRSMRSVFANGDDSCELLYEVKKDIGRVGRSAALSLFNLFAKSENKVPQSDPEEWVDQIALEGKIATDYFDEPFQFINHRPDNTYDPKGWLVLDGDTLYVKPITTQINKRGKFKHPRHIPNIGFLLMRDDRIYGAIDQASSPTMVYVLASLNQRERLVVVSFLFTSMDH